jgi:multicomponent Na+:H+ antiporter subunit E
VRRLARLVRLGGFFLTELVKANVLVAREVLSPRHTMRAAIVPVRVEAQSELEVTVLAGLLALTPGSLPVDIDRERGVLVVHAVHSPSAEAFRKAVGTLERQLLEVLR